MTPFRGKEELRKVTILKGEGLTHLLA